ncbi:hypothetical protein GCM10010218_59710 [Streptomyces mashuensis]|uniref:Uncharacterized protein n=1 Tax=Streptomyces mashuensis TaxID=33904 RepID=A0A919BA98_9ACTN|nr:hypothetical protein [Streptomyces mashuensis]GHF70518.1 hypothetical protein GCM10010218_59710 [Streptomyces mashuensis]
MRVEQNYRRGGWVGRLDDGRRATDADLLGRNPHAFGEGVDGGDPTHRNGQRLDGLLGSVLLVRQVEGTGGLEVFFPGCDRAIPDSASVSAPVSGSTAVCTREFGVTPSRRRVPDRRARCGAMQQAGQSKTGVAAVSAAWQEAAAADGAARRSGPGR